MGTKRVRVKEEWGREGVRVREEWVGKV